MSGIETGKTYHHQAWCKMLTWTWTAVECNCGAMTTPGADQAAAKAAEPIDFEQANAFANVEALGCYLSEVPNLARAYLAQQQEIERLTRHLQALPEHIWDQYIGGPRP